MRQRNHKDLRQRLLAKLEELRDGDGRERLICERSSDPMDMLQNRFEVDLTISFISNDRETRKAVATALDQLEADEYGTCRDCGAEIPQNRLEAIPWTTLCVHCQDEYDCLGVGPQPSASAGPRHRKPVRRAVPVT